MTPASAYKGKREYRYYRCSKRDREGRGACPTRPLSAQAVEAFVIERLRKIAANEKLVTRVMSAIDKRMTEAKDKLERERRELPREVGRLSSETKSLVSSLAEMGVAGRKAISLRLDQVAQALVLAQERLRTVEERLDQMGKVRAEAAWTVETLATFDRLWNKLTEDNRARLIGCLVERVVVNEGANTLRIELIDHSAEVEDAA
jgi:site-specific DNA recombinase